MDKNSYIAVFDSGVGGVSVLRELRALMAGERFYYFGDSANAPYGKKTTDQVRELTLAAGRKLLVDRDCKALVVACNTATAAAITDLRELYPDRIIVGIEPALKLACDRHPGGTIGIMATDVTLREKKLAALMGMPIKEGNSSNFVGTGIEINKYMGRGKHGHIAIGTNSVKRAKWHLEQRGYKFIEDSAVVKNGKLIAIYLEDEVAGFAVHLVQK